MAGLPRKLGSWRPACCSSRLPQVSQVLLHEIFEEQELRKPVWWDTIDVIAAVCSASPTCKSVRSSLAQATINAKSKVLKQILANDKGNNGVCILLFGKYSRTTRAVGFDLNSRCLRSLWVVATTLKYWLSPSTTDRARERHIEATMAIIVF